MKEERIPLQTGNRHKCEVQTSWQPWANRETRFRCSVNVLRMSCARLPILHLVDVARNSKETFIRWWLSVLKSWALCRVAKEVASALGLLSFSANPISQQNFSKSKALFTDSSAARSFAVWTSLGRLQAGFLCVQERITERHVSGCIKDLLPRKRGLIDAPTARARAVVLMKCPSAGGEREREERDNPQPMIKEAGDEATPLAHLEEYTSATLERRRLGRRHRRQRRHASPVNPLPLTWKWLAPEEPMSTSPRKAPWKAPPQVVEELSALPRKAPLSHDDPLDLAKEEERMSPVYYPRKSRGVPYDLFSTCVNFAKLVQSLRESKRLWSHLRRLKRAQQRSHSPSCPSCQKKRRVAVISDRQSWEIAVVERVVFYAAALLLIFSCYFGDVVSHLSWTKKEWQGHDNSSCQTATNKCGVVWTVKKESEVEKISKLLK